MLRRQFGWADVELPVIGQGTWRIREHAQAKEALLEGVRLGMTHIDAAELYEQQSRSETLLGQILTPELREGVFLASKVLPHNASYEGTIRACEASRERLNTDRIDLYYLHWWSDAHPIEDTMRAMGDLVDDGKIRYVGVSNFGVDELEAAREALGDHRLLANQVLYHMEDRGMEADVLPWCKHHNVAVVGYSPFGSDDFPSPRSPGGKVLARVAADLGKTPHQVALAFLTRDPDVFTIPKAEKVAHVRDNAGGAFELSPDALATLEEAFPLRPGLRVL